jgi:hypothetical protein
MKIETTWKDLNRMPWNAIFECGKVYRQNDPSHNGYRKYMLETWGIDHSDNHIRIADEQKYLMFLLRWA